LTSSVLISMELVISVSRQVSNTSSISQ